MIADEGNQSRKRARYEPPVLLDIEALLPKPVFISSALMSETMAWKEARQTKTTSGRDV